MNVSYWLLWSGWMCIKVFYEICLLYEMSIFLACFQSMCAYGLILSTSDVLTPFFLFPKNLRLRSLKRFWRPHWRRFGFINHPCRVGPYFPRVMPLSSHDVVFSIKTTLTFLSFHRVLKLLWPICGIVIDV